ncbi:MAG: hypothetical protein ACQEXJ_13215 [Myxococcota bacterium]
MANLWTSFDRLSRREKILVGAMLALLLGTVFFLVNLWFGSSVSDLRAKVSEDRAALEEIYAKSDDWLSTKRRAERMRQMASRNQDLNLKLAVNELAKTISFQARDRRGEPAGIKKLSDVMQFDQTQESFLSKRQRRGRDKDEESDKGYYRRDQPIALSDSVPFEAIYELMERVEESDQMLFVTDMEMTRDFQDGRIARKNASMVVSTYYYKGAEAGE